MTSTVVSAGNSSVETSFLTHLLPRQPQRTLPKAEALDLDGDGAPDLVVLGAEARFHTLLLDKPPCRPQWTPMLSGQHVTLPALAS